jgi:hypothetical protein
MIMIRTGMIKVVKTTMIMIRTGMTIKTITAGLTGTGDNTGPGLNNLFCQPQ